MFMLGYFALVYIPVRALHEYAQSGYIASFTLKWVIHSVVEAS